MCERNTQPGIIRFGPLLSWVRVATAAKRKAFEIGIILQLIVLGTIEKSVGWLNIVRWYILDAIYGDQNRHYKLPIVLHQDTGGLQDVPVEPYEIATEFFFSKYGTIIA